MTEKEQTVLHPTSSGRGGERASSQQSRETGAQVSAH